MFTILLVLSMIAFNIGLLAMVINPAPMRNYLAGSWYQFKRKVL